LDFIDMKNIRFLIISYLISSSYMAIGEKPKIDHSAAVPLESPSSWISSDDYPTVALRFNMAGVTAYKLTVDATGKINRCDIVVSSGFDILDETTCQLLMAKARFSAARDRAGKPIASTYAGRVRWALPSLQPVTVNEHFASMHLSIDQTGNVTSCRRETHLPIDTPKTERTGCTDYQTLFPPEYGLKLRGSFQGVSAAIELRLADVFSPDQRAQVLLPKPGYEQRFLNIHRITVGKDGKRIQCSYEEQRGDVGMATDFCRDYASTDYDPPFAAFDKNGVATGWHIQLVLLKTGK
jgi:hypothetical protein